MTYESFLAAKEPAAAPCGITPRDIHPALFPFQRDIVEWAVRRGRAAIFADTGLGKTRMQLEWARQVGGPALVLAPLAVAHQTIREGKALGLDVVYARSQEEAGAGVSITNYERLDRFDLSRFRAVVLDESSILKSFMGATKRALVERCAVVPYRLACTATPAPNDHMEIGNHAEFLGVMLSHEMLARWFINDTSTFGTYRLKGHAVGLFWDWVTSWARCVGKPSDLGYSDDGFVLPALEERHHVLRVDLTEERGAALFRLPELSATSIHAEKRRTAADRARRVAELVAAEPAEPWIVWCETDYEADELTALIPDAVEVRGSMKPEEKERRLVDFSEGRTRLLVTKPSLAGFGLNWQHCARMAFVGVSFSYEQLYQAIRRSWRFGQKRAVHAHIVMAETERDVFAVVKAKAEGHAEMKDQMFAAMRRAQSRDSNRLRYEALQAANVPAWLQAR